MTNIANLHSAPGHEDGPAGLLQDVLPHRKDLVSEALGDMRLKGPVRKAVDPLTGLGISLVDGLVKSPIDGEQRLVTVMARLDETYYLIMLPTWVRRSGNETRSLFSQLPNLFPEHSVLFLMGHRIDALPLVMMGIISRYSKHDLSARFVPWLHLAGPDGDPPQAEMLLRAFQLPEAQSGTRHRREPALADIELLSQRLRDYLAFAEAPQGRFTELIRRVASDSQQQDAAGGLWKGDLSLVATSFVRWAAYQGRPTLGRTVSALIEDAPGHDLAGSMLRLAEECELLDPRGVQNLRQIVSRAGGGGES